ncbi:YciI family protein [Cellulomonas xiejunii]|uniref:YciI family protein n=1 Tax=Cellulomonas xiejunii TaxID=2968083 RepID=A0ABY5KLX3_9CELL|nr:YciI family protein [Cellulomonas xiejunii]MCC2313114.1 YciI family protein [Cellulomonas xiejunii]MCC2319815.1 YciI family protein [Cellulomonas xiejunii]UUI70147.1 YciI family protein [Cellulomonas xiejunii]
MSTYAVRYTYDERAEVRDAVRPEHRAWLAGLATAGVLLGSGPFTDGEPGALLVLQAPDESALRAVLAQDPFAREGLVAATEVRGWSLVLGPWATSAS